MADSPLITLARMVGGVVLMQGNLGHQVLGQLLIMNSNEAALAAAALVVSGTSGQRSAVGQIALRTVAPALAVRALLNQQEERLERAERRLAERERALGKRRSRLRWKNRVLEGEVARLERRLRSMESASKGDAPLASPAPTESPMTASSPLAAPLVVAPRVVRRRASLRPTSGPRVAGDLTTGDSALPEPESSMAPAKTLAEVPPVGAKKPPSAKKPPRRKGGKTR